MLGMVYFTDGHTEEITNYHKYSDDDIVFYTQTGKYCFESHIETKSVPKTKMRDGILQHRAHSFRKSVVTVGSPSLIGYKVDFDEDWIVVNIDKIELYEAKNK